MPANRFVWCSAIVTLLLCTTTSTAQSQNQPLTVDVSDPSGAPVRSARLALSSRDGRLQIIRATDASGHARFELPPSSYVLDVDASGFARVTRSLIVAAEPVIVPVPRWSIPLWGQGLRSVNPVVPQGKQDLVPRRSAP